MVLEAKNIVKKFGTSLIINSIDLSIGNGQIVSIQGSSGSGKTTLLNILGLLDPPSSGKIEYYNNL